MNNGKHNDKGNKLSRLSNLHIIWVWTKRLTLVGLLVAMVWAVMNSGAGVFLAAALGFLIIRSLIRLAVRVVFTLVYIAVLLLILGLIIL